MTGWTAVVPAKRWALSKSRMAGGPQVRESLARAFALDVVETLSQVPSIDTIIIITDERELAGFGARLGAAVVQDHALLSPDPLNRAVRLGRSRAVATRPHAPIVVVPADLPAITTASMEQALAALQMPGCAFVPDASSTGTTLLSASEPGLLRPAYGPGSARTHLADGARMILEVDQRLRRDVDTAEHLQEASALGLLPRTAAVVEDLLETAGTPRALATGS